MHALGEGIERLPLKRTDNGLGFYPTYKLTHHGSMDAGRRHDTPGSETKDFITHGKICSWSFCLYQFSMTYSPMEVKGSDIGGLGWMLHRQ